MGLNVYSNVTNDLYATDKCYSGQMVTGHIATVRIATVRIATTYLLLCGWGVWFFWEGALRV